MPSCLPPLYVGKTSKSPGIARLVVEGDQQTLLEVERRLVNLKKHSFGCFLDEEEEKVFVIRASKNVKVTIFFVKRGSKIRNPLRNKKFGKIC